MALTFGIHIGHMGGPLEEMRRLWRFADARGFDWFSVSDHFQESPPQGGGLDCFESVAIMTAAALETRRVRIGSLVYCVLYRSPGVLASALTAIDHLSGGRVECGLGAGWHEIEARAFGVPFPSIGVREDQPERKRCQRDGQEAPTGEDRQPEPDRRAIDLSGLAESVPPQRHPRSRHRTFPARYLSQSSKSSSANSWRSPNVSESGALSSVVS